MDGSDMREKASSVVERLVAVHAFLTGGPGVMNADVSVQGGLVNKRGSTFVTHFSFRNDVKMFPLHVNLLVAFTLEA